jgi:exopolysaccharide production protein ExoZ
MTLPQPVDNRFVCLEIGRGIAALFITLFYATGFYEKYFGVSVFGNPFRGGHAGFEYFFVLAGFFIYTVHASDIGRPGRLRSFALQRAIHIYPMYWLIVGLLAAAMFAVPSLGAEKALTPGKALLDFLLIPREGALILPPAWALQREVIFCVAFALFLLVPRLGMMVFIVWQAAILMNTITPFAGNAIAEVALDITNIGFAFGMVGAHLVLKDRIPAPWLLTLLGLAGFAAGMTAEWYYVDTVPAGAHVFGETLEKTYYNVCAAITIPALAAWEQRSAWRVPRFLVVFGGSSFMLFLISQPMNSVIVKLLASPAVKPMLMAETAYVINMVVVVVAAMILHLVIEKPVLARLRTALRLRSPSGTASGVMGRGMSGVASGRIGKIGADA